MIIEHQKRKFYQHLRSKECTLFGSTLSKNQVRGMEAILTGFAAEVGARHRAARILQTAWLAYILATAYHETGRRMIPVREGFCSTDAGSIRAVKKLYDQGRIRTNYAKVNSRTGKSYFGRGHVQLTHASNYKKMGEKLGLDLLHNPELALDPTISAQILVRGSMDGDFTGITLLDHLPHDPVSARRAINGTDKAAQIAGYYVKFKQALTTAGGWRNTQPEPVKTTKPKEKAPRNATPETQPKKQSIVSIILGLLIKIISTKKGGQDG